MSSWSQIQNECQIKMKSNKLLAAVIAAGLSLATVLAQDTPKPEGTDQKQDQSSDGTAMKGMDMTSDLQKQDAEVDKLVAAMNGAAPEQKVDAIAALLTKLVEQRKAMRAEMEQNTTANEKNDMNMCGMMMRMKPCKCDNK